MVEGGSGVLTPRCTAAPWMRMESVAGGPISRRDSMEALIVSSNKLPQAAMEKGDSEIQFPHVGRGVSSSLFPGHLVIFRWSTAASDTHLHCFWALLILGPEGSLHR